MPSNSRFTLEGAVWSDSPLFKCLDLGNDLGRRLLFTSATREVHSTATALSGRSAVEFRCDQNDFEVRFARSLCALRQSRSRARLSAQIRASALFRSHKDP